MFKIFVINPGSTSTKLALYNDTRCAFDTNIHHPGNELAPFPDIISQYDYRRQVIESVLRKENIPVQDIDAFVGRGGLLKPIPAGTYAVDQKMLDDLRQGVQGQHASNLGGLLAFELARINNRPAFIVDPVVVDELNEFARLAGHPDFCRRSIFHALNHKAVGRKAATLLARKYSELNLIIAHLGGGISIAAHEHGRVTDVNNALDGEGPYSPERAGTLPAGDLVRLCFSGKYTREQVLKMITGRGGFVAWLGTNNLVDVMQRIEEKNDIQAQVILNGMIYQVVKEIGAMCAVLKGQVDAIVLTGGIANNSYITDQITDRVSFIAPVLLIPGEEEMEALAFGAYRVLSGDEAAKNYANEAKVYDNKL
ncbi:MAG TPA: butyrate kinase [bacterium]|nr:butyrate kinase [bacterium]HPN43353.1 butyrate kinase [bacterium]